METMGDVLKSTQNGDHGRRLKVYTKLRLTQNWHHWENVLRVKEWKVKGGYLETGETFKCAKHWDSNEIEVFCGTVKNLMG